MDNARAWDPVQGARRAWPLVVGAQPIWTHCSTTETRQVARDARRAFEDVCGGSAVPPAAITDRRWPVRPYVECMSIQEHAAWAGAEGVTGQGNDCATIAASPFPMMAPSPLGAGLVVVAAPLRLPACSTWPSTGNGHQAAPCSMSSRRPSTASPAARSALCSYWLVTHIRQPLIVVAASSEKLRSTYMSL